MAATRNDIFHRFPKLVAHVMNARSGQVVVDVGVGKTCHFAKLRDPKRNTRLIAVDVSQDELNHVTGVDEKRVANACEGLPFEDDEVDILTTRMALEFMSDTDEFMRHASRVVKPGGYAIHMLPSKFCMASIINQLLPTVWSKKLLLSFFHRESGKCGIPVRYDNCYYSKMTRIMKRHGFEVKYEYLCWFQSYYYRFFIPFFLINAFIDTLWYRTGNKNLCATMILVTKKV